MPGFQTPQEQSSSDGLAFCNTISINPTTSGNPAGFLISGPSVPGSSGININISGAPIAANSMYITGLTDAKSGSLISGNFPLGTLFDSDNAGRSAQAASEGMGPWLLIPTLSPGVFENDLGGSLTLLGDNAFFLLMFMTQPGAQGGIPVVHAGLCFSIISLPSLT